MPLQTMTEFEVDKKFRVFRKTDRETEPICTQGCCHRHRLSYHSAHDTRHPSSGELCSTDTAMSGTGNREAIFPTRMNLTLMKTKLKGASTGHSLLKRKSEALTKRFREITKRIDTAKRKMGRVMQIASFSLAEVSYAAGDVGYHVQESVKTARFRVRARQENVS
jgi:ATP synthase subunit D